MQKHEEQGAASGWLSAKLSRAKRIPTLRQLLRPQTARALSPEEAKVERERHEQRIKRMAPDATATEDQLQQFIKKQNQEWAEKQRAAQRKGSNQAGRR